MCSQYLRELLAIDRRQVGMMLRSRAVNVRGLNLSMPGMQGSRWTHAVLSELSVQCLVRGGRADDHVGKSNNPDS